MLVNARINPNGLVSMFELLLSLQRSSPGALESWFSTHPTTQDRIQHTRSVIARVPAAQLRNLSSSSSAYNSMKSRLRSLPAAPRS
jgi:predicted Zn-dependent protease